MNVETLLSSVWVEGLTPQFLYIPYLHVIPTYSFEYSYLHDSIPLFQIPFPLYYMFCKILHLMIIPAHSSVLYLSRILSRNYHPWSTTAANIRQQLPCCITSILHDVHTWLEYILGSCLFAEIQ